MASEQEFKDVYIAVVGVDGAGKSSLISTCSGVEHPDATHSVDASATELQDVSFLYNDSSRVHLIDIPGFDQEVTEETQRRTVDAINTFIAQGKTFSGIIFLHPITDDDAATTVALQNLSLLRSLCGDQAQTSTFAVLATSMWSSVTPEEGLQREHQLASSSLLSGTRAFRFEDTRESGLAILSHLLSPHNETTPLTPPRTPTLSKTIPPFQPDATPTPAPVEDESDDLSKATQTDVATDELTQSLQSARDRHLARLADMYAQMTAIAREHDADVTALLDAKVAALEARIAASLHAQRDLAAQLADLSTTHRDEVAALREQLAQERGEHAREAQARAEATHALLARREDEFARAVEAVRAEMARNSEERVRLLSEEMAGQAEERVKAAREEMATRGDERVQAVKEEMQKQKLEFEREREMNMRAMKAEMSRLVEAEKEARERAKKAEMARRGDETYKPLQAWAVARLWGVGQQKSSAPT